MSAMLLTVKSIVKGFQDVTVLNGVSLDLAAGETLALTGESGSGKSTLLHIIAGLEPFDQGEVCIGDTALSSLDERGRAALRRRKVGIVFQQFNLIPSLTVAQNITFQARLAGYAYGKDAHDELVGQLGLSEHLGKYPEQLSGGQQQRVAIARAILPSPRLILADEPTGNLDEAAADRVFAQLLAQARIAGAALLIVTHSKRLAERADRRLHLSKGRVSE